LYLVLKTWLKTLDQNKCLDLFAVTAQVKVFMPALIDPVGFGSHEFRSDHTASLNNQECDTMSAKRVAPWVRDIPKRRRIVQTLVEHRWPV
jgi:hypothetical protein